MVVAKRMQHTSDQHPISPARSRNMAAIKGRDTKPELTVRKVLHRLGYRFRLHRRDLPGTPDIVLPKYQTVIFVHGCFWHRHRGCAFTANPKTRMAFWEQKFRKNIERDNRNQEQLSASGWNVVVVWECELADLNSLMFQLSDKLNRSVRVKSRFSQGQPKCPSTA